MAIEWNAAWCPDGWTEMTFILDRMFTEANILNADTVRFFLFFIFFDNVSELRSDDLEIELFSFIGSCFEWKEMEKIIHKLDFSRYNGEQIVSGGKAECTFDKGWMVKNHESHPNTTGKLTNDTEATAQFDCSFREALFNDIILLISWLIEML